MAKHAPTNRRRKAAPSTATFTPAPRAAMLDRLAGAELQRGHHPSAERLAWRAAELRRAAR